MNQDYNQRLDKILNSLVNEVEWCVNPSAGAVSVNREKEQTAQSQAKQAIIKLIEDEVREAVWKEKERIYEFATRKQANGLYVPIELGIEPWLRGQL